MTANVKFKQAFFERRMGSFVLTMRDLLDHPEEVHELLSKTLIMEARHRYDCNGIEYLAISPLFDKVPFGHEAPRVHVCTTLIAGRPLYEFSA